MSSSFTECYDTARSVAAVLRALGVLPGERVALVARARREAAEFVAGAALVGAILVPLPRCLDEAAFERLIDESAIRVLLVDDPSTLARCLASRRLPGVRRIVVMMAHATRGWCVQRLEDVLTPMERPRVMLWPEFLPGAPWESLSLTGPRTAWLIPPSSGA